MGLTLLKRLLLPFLISYCPQVFGSANKLLDRPNIDSTYFISRSYIKDTTVTTRTKNLKICSCQILDLQSNNHRQRNIALLAERSNVKSLSYDLSRISKVMLREKRHMQNFFYDKLVVIDSFTENTDCRSLYLKLKRKNKYLVLYDILDADAIH